MTNLVKKLIFLTKQQLFDKHSFEKLKNLRNALLKIGLKK